MRHNIANFLRALEFEVVLNVVSFLAAIDTYLPVFTPYVDFSFAFSSSLILYCLFYS